MLTYWQQRSLHDFRPPLHVLKTYLKSKRWYAIRAKYRRMDLPRQCLICGSANFELHHTNYRHLGKEHPMSLRPLCLRHHKELHQTLNRLRLMLSQTDVAIRHLALENDFDAFWDRFQPWAKSGSQ